VIVPYSDERSRQKASMKRAQQRRRRLLGLLGAGVVVSGVVAVMKGQPWLEVHLIFDGVLLFYVALLHESKRRRDERVHKVRRLAPRSDEDVRLAGPMSAGGEHL
jgi:hypothetical protein